MANSYTWTGSDNATPTDFSDPLNWDPTTGPPTNTDDANITDGVGVTAGSSPVQITKTTEVNNLTIDDGALNDTGFVLTVDTNIVVGGTSTNDGTPNSLLSVGGGGEIDAGYLDIGQGSGNGGSVTFDASTLKVTNSIVVGDATVGQLFVDDGASVTAGTFISVGVQSQSVGLLSINNSTVTLSTSISGMDVGVDAGSSGDVELNYSAQLTISTFLSIGQDGEGTLGIHSGSVVNVGPITNPVPLGTGDDLGVGVGNNLNGFGTVSIDGHGSELNVSRQIYVGGPTSNGGNSLTIGDNGLVQADLSGDAQASNIDAVALAFETSEAQSNGKDLITITGTGSELDANGTIVVGVDGVGEIDVFAGGTLTGHEYSTGTSGESQFAGSIGTILVDGAGSTYTDQDFNVGGGGTAYLTVQNGGAVVLGSVTVGTSSTINNVKSFGTGTISVDGAGTTLTTDNINLAGDFGGPSGGSGTLIVSNGALVTVAGTLGVLGNSNGLGTLDLTNIGNGTLAVGAFIPSEDATLFQGDLVLNPGGILNLDNGVIRGGTLFFNGNAMDVTPVLEQIDDQHSVLDGVTIVGQDLTVTSAVLTLANSTNGAFGDNVLINATSSLIDLRSDFGPYSLSQIINATDVALTVDASSGGGGGPNFIIGPTGNINGTGAIFSDYTSPSSDGFFSGDVSLLNHGLIDAIYNDASSGLSLSLQAQLSILTNTITNAPDGTFEADSVLDGPATLNIGNSAVPLDNSHVFTNLQDNGDGTSSLVDGLYNANGGNIDVNGPLNPISTLEAVLYLTGVGSFTGNLFVNGISIEQSLTTITPSSVNGEGNLAINFANVNFDNPIEIQGLLAGEPSSWSINNPFIFGTGGGLYLDQGTFSGPGLTIDAATSGLSAFIYGDGTVNAPVTMDGTTTVFDYGSGGPSSIEFAQPVVGSGTYEINGASLLWFNSTLGNPGDPVSENTVDFIPDPNGSSLWIEPSDVYVEPADLSDNFRATGFRATITNFSPQDDIALLSVHATSATFDSATDQLDLFNAKGVEVATLQLDNTIPADQTFEVSPFAGNAGGTDIRWANSSFDPVISSSSGPDGFTGDVTENPANLVETFTTSGLSFSDVNPEDFNPFFVRIEGDPPLGSLTVADGPLETAFATNSVVTLQNTGGSLNLTYTVSDSAISFLQSGETKTDTFYVELSDGQATLTQPFTVTIHGTNQAPVTGNIDLSTTGFSLDGAASVSTAAHPDDTTGGNLYNLLPTISSQADTPAGALGQAGAVWEQVNLAQSLTVHAELFFGTGVFNHFNSGGGDGITFTLQDQGANAIGSANSSGTYPTSGGFLGIGGTPPGNSPGVGFVPGIADAMGVKFDTFNNGPPEPNGDQSFAQFFTNGDNETPPGANPDQINTGNLDNGSWHDLVVTWTPITATTGTLTYTLDGTITDTIQEDTSVFASSNSPVFAGFTGASGSAYSPEQVEIVSVTNGTDSAADFAGGVTDIAGLTASQLSDAGSLTTGGTFDFSDVNQLDTHTHVVPVTNGTIVSHPSYYTSSDELGTLTATVTTDTTGTGNGGQVTWNFSVADSDVAFLKAGDQIVETFNVNVTDNNGGITPQPVTITITGSNNTPTANPDSYSVHDNHTLTVNAASGVLANDTDPDSDTTLTAAVVSTTTHGALTLNADGSFGYTPNAGFVGTDTFTYHDSDGALTSNTATVTINVTDTAPVAVNDSYSVHDNHVLNVPGPGVLGNDTDADGDTLTAAVVSTTTHGALTLNADGSFGYTPNAGFVGTDTFTYNDSDGALTSNTATVTIDVTDTAPVAVNDSYSVHDNHALNIIAPGVLGNDTDAEGDTLTAAVVSTTTHGALTLNADGSFGYTPNAGFVGTDTFTYNDSDGALTSNTATVTIDVTDTAPVAVNDNYSVHDNHALNIIAPGVLGNDTDADGDTLTAAVVSTTTHGALTLNADGSFGYTPNAGFVGTDTFTYNDSDGALTSNTATVTINVTDTAPVANDDSYSVLDNHTLNVTAPGVLTNDTDADGDTLTAAVVSTTTHGALTLNADGSFGYTPNSGFVGTDTFTYNDSDGALTSNTATVTINVTASDTAPVANDDSYSVHDNHTLNVTAPGVLGNDTDAEGDTLTAALVTSTTHGALAFNADGSFGYTPDAGFVGTDTFTYNDSDGTLTGNTATVTIDVTDTAPVANDDSYSVHDNHTLNVTAPGVLGNDTDAEGDTLTAALVTSTTHGALAFNADGSFGYTPDAGFVGTDTFTYNDSDGTLTGNTATVTIDVTDTAPVANDDSYSVHDNHTLNVTAPGILGNDTDAEGDTLTAALVTSTTHGALAFNADGSFGYTPDAGFVGTDTFTYKDSDGTLTGNTATVTINVTDTAPVANDDSYSVHDNHTLNVTAPGVLGNDTDAEGDTLTAALVTTTTHGALAFNADGSFGYTPDVGFVGTDTFTYKDSDGALTSNTATVTIDVTDTAPVAVNDSYSVHDNHALNIIAPGVLTNDTDADGDTLTAAVVSTTTHGALTLNADGSFGYTPNAGFVGTDTFTYKDSDGALTSNTATVTIDVTDTAPVAVNDSYSVHDNHALNIIAPGVLGNDTDADGDTLTAAVVSTTTHGALTLNADGSFGYTPNAGFVGTDTFTYNDSDGALTSNTATVTINVTDTAPVAVNDSYSTNLDQALHIGAPGVLVNDTDAEGDQLSAVLGTGPSHGNLSFGTDGSFTYTPFLAFLGNDSFTYEANDGALNSNTATVSVAVNDGPNTFDFSQDPNGSLNWTINLGASPETAFNSKTGTQTFTGDNNVVTGSGNNTIIGNNNNDVLIGGAGNDMIRAGNGNTIVAGGGGTNSLIGGTGHDTFVFTQGSFTDTIASFNVNNDQLDFQGFAGLTGQNLNNQILADVTSAHTAASTVIQLAPTDSITLVGVTYNQLAASHPFELNV